MEQELEFYNDSQISYTDFIYAILDVKKCLTKERLTTIFKKFDENENGRISPDCVFKTLNASGFTVTAAQAEDLVTKYDYSKKGYIQLKDFKSMMVFG